MSLLAKTWGVVTRARRPKFKLRPAVYDRKLDTRHGEILYVENVSVSFDGFLALNQLNLYVNDGELRCIIGPNGAGKTTMMDVITGKTRPDSGTVWFGQQIDLLNLDEPSIAQAGIGRIFQKPTVFEQQSVFSNLKLAMHADKRVWSTLFAKLTAEQADWIDETLGTIGLIGQRKVLAGSLSHGQKQWLEIGMLLMQRPKLLLALEGKHSIIVVEHDMEFVRSIARKVTVLHEGSVLAEGDMDTIQNDRRVADVYLETLC